MNSIFGTMTSNLEAASIVVRKYVSKIIVFSVTTKSDGYNSKGSVTFSQLGEDRVQLELHASYLIGCIIIQATITFRRKVKILCE